MTRKSDLNGHKVNPVGKTDAGVGAAVATVLRSPQGGAILGLAIKNIASGTTDPRAECSYQCDVL